MFDILRRAFENEGKNTVDGATKLIKYYLFQSHIDFSQYQKVINQKNGLWKVEKLNELQKVERVNHFDKNFNEDRVTEFIYDNDQNLLEQQEFQNFYQESLKKTVKKVFTYEQELVKEIKVFDFYRYKTSDSYAGRQIYEYDNNKRLIREEYRNSNDKVTEIRIFSNVNQYESEELRLSARESIKEKHVHVIDDRGLEVERRINLNPKSKDENSFPTIYKYSFNDKGDKIRTLWALNGVVKEDFIFDYKYSDKDWIYRVTTNLGKVVATEFRKMEI